MLAVAAGSLLASSLMPGYAQAANQPPVAVIKAEQQHNKLSVNFDGSGSSDQDGKITSYAWDFGNGKKATGAKPVHNYAAAGTYDVSLTVTDNNKASKSTSLSVQVQAPNKLPVARGNAVQQKNSFLVKFNGSKSTDADGAITNYHWEFGDGHSAVGVAPEHLYATAGTYQAKLTVTDNHSKAAQHSTELKVMVNAPPTPVYSWSQFPGEPILIFAGADSTDPDDHIVSYHWDFGDGTAGTGQDVSHMYNQAGNYQVTFTVKDAFGNSSSSRFAVTVAGKPNMEPVAQATATAVPGSLEFIFSAAGSLDYDGEISSYLWDFGDGTSSTAAQSRHLYSAAGQYQVSLTVTDNMGATHSVGLAVDAALQNQLPVALATTAVTAGSLQVRFDGRASSDADGSISSYHWDFGDGHSATGETTSHTYASAGQYPASLTVTDNSGAQATLLLPVAVNEQTSSGKWVTGYYAGWFWEGYQPQNIDFSAMTHVIFGRVAPGSGTLGGQAGQVMPGSGSAHEAGRLPAGLTAKSAEDYLIERAHAAGTKALLMLGGNDDGNGFYASTAPGIRSTFVTNLLNYLEQHNYDGIDVNWEDAIDPERLIALITELKQAAADRPRYQSQPLLVTYPTSILNMNYETVPQWKVQVAELVDQFNLMTYMIGFAHGGWTTWHFSPIYGQTGLHPSDVSSTVDAYAQAGIPRSKLAVGIGFFGFNFRAPATGPDQPVTYQDNNDWTWSYANLVNCGFLSAGSYTFDHNAKAAYRSYVGGYTGSGPQHSCMNTGEAGFLSYEDPASIAAKGKYVRDTELGGAMIWVINYGSPDGVNNPLLNAVKQSFRLGHDNVQPFAVISSKLISQTELRFEFDGTASMDSNNQAVASYSWTFGDGASASGAKPVHTYVKGGAYTVSLTVTDINGVSNTVTAVVQAVQPPPPDVMPKLETIPVAAGATPWVTAYYAGWYWPDHQPQHINMDSLTHLVFGRVAPGGGSLPGGQPGDVIEGAGTAHDAGAIAHITDKSVEDYLIERAHAAGKKALLMMGGMGDGLGFLASTAPDIRPTFVNNILNYLEQHDYDGLDLDWEDELDSPLAQFRLTALIADLRAAAKLRARWQAPNDAFLITFPGYALNMNYGQVSEFDVTIASIVDQYNLMSYAMGFAEQGWTSTTFSPIAGLDPSRPMDLTSSMQAYQNAGVPRGKLGVGIGFYCMAYPLPTTGFGQPVTGVFSNDNSWSYSIVNAAGYFNGGTRIWNDEAKMSFYSYPNGRTGTHPYNSSTIGMLSCEDPQSIAAKGEWVKATGLGGAIIWTINYGSTNGVNNPLMDAVRQSFLQTE